MTAFVTIDRISKRFGEVTAADAVSLSIDRGEILALLGPSGSGKTTMLRLLAGFEKPDSGRILVGDEDLTAAPPARRHFGMVFQHYALFPHLDVSENVGFGLVSAGVRGEELRRRVAEALARVDMAGFERRRVSELSGGQQQRVAVARALAPEPRVLLLDEPLSNLDPALRERTRLELRQVIRRAGITTVIVTHEQDEAFDLGERVALLRNGRLEQFGTPADLYERPSNAFVAGFVGRASALDVEVVEQIDDWVRVQTEGIDWTIPVQGRLRTGAARLLIRPEALTIGAPSAGTLCGSVTDCRYTGASGYFRVTTDGGGVLEVSADPGAAIVGSRVSLTPGSRGLHLFQEGGREE